MPLLLSFAMMMPISPVDKPEPAAIKFWVYVGTYTGGTTGSQGIYRLEFDAATGKLSPGNLMAVTESPSFLAIHPNHQFLYAANEIGEFEGKKTGAVSAFSIDPKTGKLTLLNQKSSGGPGPCFVSTDKAGRFCLVANYNGGSAEVLQILDDGRLGEVTALTKHIGNSVNKERQEAPHAHSINLDNSNGFAMVADLGLDFVKIYHFDKETGVLTKAASDYGTARGAGPRHFAFHPNGKWAYVINELNLTLSALDYNPASGILKTLQTVSTLPKGADRTGASTAEVVVHPNGKFVYGSNRGNNTIAAFAIDGNSGKLTLIGHQAEGIKTPRNFAIDPTGKYLIVANQDGASLVVFRIDERTGALKPTGVTAQVPTPVCVRFVPVPPG